MEGETRSAWCCSDRVGAVLTVEAEVSHSLCRVTVKGSSREMCFLPIRSKSQKSCFLLFSPLQCSLLLFFISFFNNV